MGTSVPRHCWNVQDWSRWHVTPFIELHCAFCKPLKNWENSRSLPSGDETILEPQTDCRRRQDCKKSERMPAEASSPFGEKLPPEVYKLFEVCRSLIFGARTQAHSEFRAGKERASLHLIKGCRAATLATA